jgi:hypothetical protein
MMSVPCLMRTCSWLHFSKGLTQAEMLQGQALAHPQPCYAVPTWLLASAASAASPAASSTLSPAHADCRANRLDCTEPSSMLYL